MTTTPTPPVEGEQHPDRDELLRDVYRVGMFSGIVLALAREGSATVLGPAGMQELAAGMSRRAVETMGVELDAMLAEMVAEHNARKGGAS